MTNSEGPRVAVLGAGGVMGAGMTHNLESAAGLEVRAWSRTREKVRSPAVRDTAEEAVAGADVVVTTLPDGPATAALVEGGVLAAMRDGAVWMQCATVGIQETVRFAERAAERGVVFVDAPVLGTAKPAMDGALVVLASGPEEARGAIAPVCDAIGGRTIWLGAAGGGTRLKLVVNAWLLALVEGMAEAIALAEGLGLDPRLFLDAVKGGGIDTPYLHLKGGAMIDRALEPAAFKLGLAAKDAALAAAAADGAGLDLPLLDFLRDRFAAGASAHPDLDLAATFLTAAGPVAERPD